MTDFFTGMSVLQQAFWYSALLSSIIFLLQTILTFAGVESSDLDTDFDGDFHHVDAPFEWFTFRNLINFLLGFGWTGVAFFFFFFDYILVALATLVGLIFVAIFFIIIKQFLKLQEDNTFQMEKTIGKTAEVYLKIPAHKSGTGKIQVSINGSFHELNAVTEGEEILSGESVKIINTENKILIVEKI